MIRHRLKGRQILESILSDRPKLHELKGEAQDWGVSNDLATFIFEQSERKKTLEIGSGLSTIAFLLSSEDHTCINPRAADREKLERELVKWNVSKRPNFIQERSEKICPNLSGFYDMILIDGSHTFPWPIIDWYYTGTRLRRNGIMILDDVDWWPVGILDSYMKASDLWALRFGNERFSCFEALEQGDSLISHRWELQPNLTRFFE